jgi:CheY-like chemotaxis protein
VEVLQSLRYRVLASADATSALQHLKNHDQRIDLLLTDVVMPKVNGRQLAMEAALLRPELPILFMTGYSRNAIAHQGRLDDGVDIMQKPVSQAQLANRVRIALDRNRRSRNAPTT